MPIGKLIVIREDGTLKEDIYFEKKDKTFTQELREGLDTKARERVSEHINKVLNDANVGEDAP